MLVIIENKAGERYAVTEHDALTVYQDTDFKIVEWASGEPYKAGQPAGSEAPGPSVPRKVTTEGGAP